MKLRILLLLLIVICGCVNANATDRNPGIPGKNINEVAGNVIDADTKKPLKDVVVTAYFSSKKEKYVITDDLGHFDFDELKTGVYKLVFERAGYRKVTKDKLSIKADETFQMKIEMIEESDFNLMPSPFHFIDTQ